MRESVCKLTGAICRWCAVVSESDHPDKRTKHGLPYIVYTLECGRTELQAPYDRPRKSVWCDSCTCPDHPEYLSDGKVTEAFKEFCSKSAERLREEGYEVRPDAAQDVGKPIHPWSVYRDDGQTVFVRHVLPARKQSARRQTRRSTKIR